MASTQTQTHLRAEVYLIQGLRDILPPLWKCPLFFPKLQKCHVRFKFQIRKKKSLSPSLSLSHTTVYPLPTSDEIPFLQNLSPNATSLLLLLSPPPLSRSSLPYSHTDPSHSDTPPPPPHHLAVSTTSGATPTTNAAPRESRYPTTASVNRKPNKPSSSGCRLQIKLYY